MGRLMRSIWWRATNPGTYIRAWRWRRSWRRPYLWLAQDGSVFYGPVSCDNFHYIRLKGLRLNGDIDATAESSGREVTWRCIGRYLPYLKAREVFAPTDHAALVAEMARRGTWSQSPEMVPVHPGVGRRVDGEYAKGAPDGR